MENNNQKPQYGVSTDEIMDYLKDNMVTRKEFKEEISRLDQKISQTKLEIVDHIDDKLADLKGDLVVLMRKEDKKLISLIELLMEKKLITPAEAKSIFQMEPFPQLIV